MSLVNFLLHGFTHRTATKEGFVSVDDPNLGPIIGWAIQHLPGARAVKALAGWLQVEQVVQGRIGADGVLTGEIVHVAGWEGVVSMSFDWAASEVAVVRRLRWSEVPAEFWGSWVA